MIKFTLSKALDDLGLTRNMLSVMAEVRSNTIIDMVDGKIRRMDIESVDRVLNVLNELAREKGINREYGIDDIIVYVSNGT